VLGRQLDECNERDRTPDQNLDGLPQAVGKLADLYARVAVEGPASVADQAHALLVQARVAHEAVSDLLAVPEGETEKQEVALRRGRKATEQLNTELGLFMDLARQALDDDGSH
jgi:hypothetical protein